MTSREMLKIYTRSCNFSDYSEEDFYNFSLDLTGGDVDPYIERVNERLGYLNNSICYYGWCESEEKEIKDLERLLRALYKRKAV